MWVTCRRRFAPVEPCVVPDGLVSSALFVVAAIHRSDTAVPRLAGVAHK